jgi:hypothetical protein
VNRQVGAIYRREHHLARIFESFLAADVVVGLSARVRGLQQQIAPDEKQNLSPA